MRFCRCFAVFLAVGVASGPLRAEPAGSKDMPTASKDVLIIKESNVTQTVDAAGRDVTINGSGVKLTVTGECHALTVSGGSNVVSLDSVATITLGGDDNQVKWAKAVDGEKPQVTDQGKGNVIAKKKAE